MTTAAAYAKGFMWSGMFALVAIAWPTAVGIGGTFDFGTKPRICRRYSRDKSSIDGPTFRSRDG